MFIGARLAGPLAIALSLSACVDVVEQRIHIVDKKPALKPETPITDEAFLAVWAGAPDDAWAVGDHGTIAHFDGTKWTLAESGTTEQLSAVHGSGPDNVWAEG